MFIKSIEKIIPATKEYSVIVACDLCGVEQIKPRTWPDSRKLYPYSEKDDDKRFWGHFDIQDSSATLQLVSLDSYEDYDTDESIGYDFCPKCFVEKLMPFVEANSPHKFKLQGLKDEDQLRADEIKMKEYTDSKKI